MAAKKRRPQTPRYEKAKALVDDGMTIGEACKKARLSPKAFYQLRSREKNPSKYQAIMLPTKEDRAENIDERITLTPKQLAQFVKEFHR
jgi:hypothetical protein